MSNVKFDLTIRLDEAGGRFLFFTTQKRIDEGDGAGDDAQEFTVEISMGDLKNRGGAGAEKLVGESVLGFFDHLTDGRLDLPKHYRDEK